MTGMAVVVEAPAARAATVGTEPTAQPTDSAPTITVGPERAADPAPTVGAAATGTSSSTGTDPARSQPKSVHCLPDTGCVSRSVNVPHTSLAPEVDELSPEGMVGLRATIDDVRMVLPALSGDERAA
ncbi:hypothetical protein ACFVT2_37725 [Streptomyces sp. NPDC058000]|uniref:hypothetical protein n=1 Tax=Streptomyces sp. NPDC058000 TaxID=3346299 RepID=UPI0036E3E648